jgi:PAS domain-containing protein
MGDARHSIFTETGYRPFLLLVCSIFFGEMLIMILLDRRSPLSRWGAAFFDAALLIILVFPILHFLVLRPLMVHITERKQAEEALRRSEEAAKRLAQENALVAEMGRIIGSTPNIEEVFERFSEKVAKLIPSEGEGSGGGQNSPPVNSYMAKQKAIFGHTGLHNIRILEPIFCTC